MSSLEKPGITILSFEGPDKVGKTTLIKEVNRAADYRFLCIDRFTASAWVFDKLSNRRDRTDALIKAEEELRTLETIKALTILLFCDPEILRRRILEKDEYPKIRLLHLNTVLAYYQEYEEKIAGIPIIKVDTTQKTINETVLEILEGVKRYE